MTEEAPQTFSVSGTVTTSDGGAASGASVMLVKISDSSDAGQSPVGATGEYIITGVEAGIYRITVMLAGYETGLIDDVKIADADVTGKDLEFRKITVPTYFISGAVTKPDGGAAAGASVQILNASDNIRVGQPATTGAAGEYSIGDIPAGTYNIIITLDGIDAGLGTAEITGGSIRITSAADDTKGIKATRASP